MCPEGLCIPPDTLGSKPAFEDIEFFGPTMMDVLGRSVVRRHDTLGQSVPPIGVFTDCLIGEQDFLDPQAHTFAWLKNPRAAFYRGC
jgi:hypothetical protein